LVLHQHHIVDLYFTSCFSNHTMATNAKVVGTKSLDLGDIEVLPGSAPKRDDKGFAKGCSFCSVAMLLALVVLQGMQMYSIHTVIDSQKKLASHMGMPMLPPVWPTPTARRLMQSHNNSSSPVIDMMMAKSGVEEVQKSVMDGVHRFHVVDQVRSSFSMLEVEGMREVTMGDNDVMLHSWASGGKVTFEVLVLCELGENCHLLIPDTEPVKSGRRLRGTPVRVDRRLAVGMALAGNALTAVVTWAMDEIKSGCFPSNSMVMLQSTSVPIQNLLIGDQLVGQHGLSPFFLQGHHHNNAVTEMISLTTVSNHTVTATPDHYFPLASGGYASAANIPVGSSLWVRTDDGFVPSVVSDKMITRGVGLFNPYTTSGDLVVNGVLASSHSSWFLEGFGLADSTIVNSYSTIFWFLATLYNQNPNAFRCFDEAVPDELALNDVAMSKIFSLAVQSFFKGPCVGSRVHNGMPSNTMVHF